MEFSFLLGTFNFRVLMVSGAFVLVWSYADSQCTASRTCTHEHAKAGAHAAQSISLQSLTWDEACVDRMTATVSDAAVRCGISDTAFLQFYARLLSKFVGANKLAKASANAP